MVRPLTKQQLYDHWVLKPHTIVYHAVDRTFYEVRSQGLTPDVYHADQVTEKGTVVTWLAARVIYRRDVELIASTHPVYIKWAARRLQDRLEGLDRD